MIFFLYSNVYQTILNCEILYYKKFNNPRENYLNSLDLSSCINTIFLYPAQEIPSYAFLKKFPKQIYNKYKKDPFFSSFFQDIIQQESNNERAQQLVKDEKKSILILKEKPSSLFLIPTLKKFLRFKKYSDISDYINKLGHLEQNQSFLNFLRYYTEYKKNNIPKAIEEFSKITNPSSQDLFWGFFFTKNTNIQNTLIQQHPFSFYTVLSYVFYPRNIPWYDKDHKNIQNKDLFDQYVKECKKNTNICLANIQTLHFFNEDPIALSQYSSKKKQYILSFQLLSSLINHHGYYVKIFNELFPKPFLKTIKNHCSQDHFLILSQMRQESAFNPNAKSTAQAKGLLQILESTAKMLKKSFDLFHPEDNIEIGCKYLEQLNKKYSLFLSLAAYNAGPRQVETWIKESFFNQSVFDFFEEIPFEETNIYTKLIIRNFFFYKVLNGEDPIPFLKQVLDIKPEMTDVSIFY
jgi:hypothetical protein